MTTLNDMLNGNNDTDTNADADLGAQLAALESKKARSKLLGTFRFLSPLSSDLSPQFGFKVINGDTLESRDYSDRLAAELFKALFNEEGVLRDGVRMNDRGNPEFNVPCELVLPKTDEQLEEVIEEKTAKALSMFGN